MPSLCWWIGKSEKSLSMTNDVRNPKKKAIVAFETIRVLSEFFFSGYIPEFVWKEKRSHTHKKKKNVIHFVLEIRNSRHILYVNYFCGSTWYRTRKAHCIRMMVTPGRIPMCSTYTNVRIKTVAHKPRLLFHYCLVIDIICCLYTR